MYNLFLHDKGGSRWISNNINLNGDLVIYNTTLVRNIDKKIQYIYGDT